MSLIDLGEVTEETAAPAVPLNLPRLRRLALAVLAVAGLLALGAAAPPAPPLVRPLWTAAFQPSDVMALDAGAAYLNQSDDGRPPTLTAYDLATGAVRWQRPSGVTVSGYPPRPAGDVLLVPADPELIRHEEADKSVSYYQLSRSTLALDAATGERLWQTAGDAHPTAGLGEAVITEADETGAVTRLRLVRLRDGHEVWGHTITPVNEWTWLGPAGRPTEIATVTKTGDVTVYGYADGVVRHRGRLPWAGLYTASLGAAGPYLLVNRRASAQTIATVYRSDDLRPLWRSDDLIGYGTACGGLICTTGAHEVVGHDPATGRVVWRTLGVQDLWDVGGERLLLNAVGTGVPTMVLIDAATGRAIGAPVAGQPAQVVHPEGSIYLLRGTTTPRDRTAVVRFDLATGRSTMLGTIGAIGEQGCAMVPGYLACPAAGRLTVTAAG
jgi:putative pyrroloquinoline-quinone binding quinoprotein